MKLISRILLNQAVKTAATQTKPAYAGFKILDCYLVRADGLCLCSRDFQSPGLGVQIKRIKRILSVFLALGVCLTPVTVPLMVQPSWGQTQNSQAEEVNRLLEQAAQQTQQGQPQQAIQTFKQALAIARELKVRESEATALLGLGLNYDNIGQPQQALDYYNQALPIFSRTYATGTVRAH